MTVSQKGKGMRKYLGRVGFVALLVPPALAQVTATVSGGFDDNPFKLSSNNNDDETGFLDAEVRLEQDLGSHFAIDARVRHVAADGGSEDASRTTYSAILEYENESELFGVPAEFMVHGRAAGSDKTFVSRNTGTVGVFAGSPVPNRFDYNSFELRGRLDLEVTDQSTLRVQLDARDRTYEDYTDLGLSNLDYQQVFANLVWRYQPSEYHDIRFGTSFGERAYDNREGRALDGSFVAGSNLDFSFFGADASWKYDFNDENDIRISYDYNMREDSVAGYFDTTRHTGALRYRYRPDTQNRFAAELTYSDFEYDNIPASAIINNEENLGPNDGISASLSYDRELFDNDEREVWLETKVILEDFDSPNVNFVYDRSVLQIGLKFEF